MWSMEDVENIEECTAVLTSVVPRPPGLSRCVQATCGNTGYFDKANDLA